MEQLWHYDLCGALTNENAGYSMWGFGTRDGTEYFIKQFLTPKYPVNDTQSSPERLEKRRRQCERFVARKRAVYRALNRGSDGNGVRVREFFRVKSRFYLAMDKVEALPWTMETISALPPQEIRRLCAIIAHAVAGLHRAGLIHADLKHENILYTKTASGAVTAKVIDFDSSFLESDLPGPEEEITGDFLYFAPEVIARTLGEPCAPLSRKLDVFALGVLFYRYFSGQVPAFEGGSYDYPGNAVRMGLMPRLDSRIPEDLAPLFQAMLRKDPADRPEAAEVFARLRALEYEPAAEPPVEETLPPDPAPVDAPISPNNGGGFFYQAGDL